MPKPAEVLFQKGGSGVILFVGQTVPAAAIRADALKHLHDLSRDAIECAKAGDTESDQFRCALQELHLEIATLLLSLQDTGLRHGAELPRELQVDSRDFVRFDEGGAR